MTAISRLHLQKGIFQSKHYFALSALVHLEYISFPDSMRITDIEIVATMLKSLKRIHFGISNLNHVKIFLGANSKLEYIQIDWFMDEAGKVDKKKVLDLIGLNKKRAELPNSKKVSRLAEPILTQRIKRE